MNINAIDITIHEAAEILRAAVEQRLGAPAGSLGKLNICSYDQARVTIEYDEPGGSHRWEQHRTMMHLTHGGTV